MKQLSRWASHHIIAARFSIVASWILLITIGAYFGIQLQSLAVSLPFSSLIVISTLFLTAFFLYPSRNNKKKKFTSVSFYTTQKSCDFIIAFSSFFMFVYLSNHADQVFQYNNTVNATVPVASIQPKDSSTTYKSLTAFSASLKDGKGNPLKWKERKKLLKEQVKAIKKAKEPSKGEKFFLITLSVLVALLLLGLVASLACTISCNGSGFLAAVVFGGGTVLIACLLIAMIRSITGKQRKRKKLHTDLQ